MSPGAQNKKKRSGALGTAENEYGHAKHEKWDPTTSIPPKMSPDAQNVKTGLDALGTAENEFGSTKHENGTWRTQHR
jgi:hypothetical protein